MGWMVQLTPPGYVAAGLIFSSYHAVAAGVAPAGRWGVIGRPAAHTLVEAIRLSLPFGGVPLATMGVSQVGGPLAPLASVGGVILLTWVVFQIGFVLADAQAWRMGGSSASSATATAPCSPTSLDALRLWWLFCRHSSLHPARRRAPRCRSPLCRAEASKERAHSRFPHCWSRNATSKQQQRSIPTVTSTSCCGPRTRSTSTTSEALPNLRISQTRPSAISSLQKQTG